ncbi:hypothetical protein [Phaeovulum sp. NW3]|uniref:hypothetical protein n=1 Tax=Phaeovulum sp. NW3 TaxID=2934933 RepID=UPI0020210623|nr:hypothetical protein [Phaeovulum sp. NW3]MCL7464299.1 hypothetical protein [Phaeovulum sp. NW3]
MIDRLMALVAFLIFAGFLGIILMHVPRLDLGIAIGATLVLAGWDFFGKKHV